MNVLSVEEMQVIASQIEEKANRETTWLQNIADGMNGQPDHPLAKQMQAYVQNTRQQIMNQEIGKIFPIVLTLPQPPTVFMNQVPTTLSLVASTPVLASAPIPWPTGENETEWKTKDQLFQMTIHQIYKYVNRHWAKQRETLKKLDNRSHFLRENIERSLLCEFFTQKSMLMKMDRGQFSILPKNVKRKCQILMEISTWRSATNWECFEDLAEEELKWGQERHRLESQKNDSVILIPSPSPSLSSNPKLNNSSIVTKNL